MSLCGFRTMVRKESTTTTAGLVFSTSWVIVLRKKKNTALVEITLPKDANIHAREYQLYLPSKEELQLKLEEWIEEQATESE
jgi:hypothetical protein